MSFFCNSDNLDRDVLRPLSHIKACWELTWEASLGRYVEEKGSYAALLNDLIAELGKASPPLHYHDNEDRLAVYVRDVLGWPLRKHCGRWLGADYAAILEQGGFDDLDEGELVLATAGRIRAAQARGQHRYDDMEQSHRIMLAAVLSIILYHRTKD